MKKLGVSLFIAISSISCVLAGAQLIITSNLDDKSMPVDKLSSIPFDKDRQYLLFLFNEDYSALGVEKIYFEISSWDDKSGDYKYEDLYTVDTHTDWSYCYQGIFFNVPKKYKIRVFSNNAELVTRYIEVLKQD